MEALIIVERLGRHGELLERQRQRIARGQSLHIGRGWDCAIHLDDPYVALHHATLEYSAEGELAVRDAGSLNGIVDVASGARAQRFAIDPSRELRMGHARLRLIDGRAGQAAERPLLLDGSRIGWAGALAWLAAALGLSVLLDWMGQVGEVRSSALLISALAGGVFLLAWCFGWALITRLFSGEMRFLRHLRVAAIGALLASVLALLVRYLSYGLAFEPLARFSYIGYWLLFAAVCWRHLSVMGPAHPRSKATAMLGMALAAIGLQSLSLWQPQDGEERGARYVRNVVIPAFRLRPTHDVEQFLDRAAALESALVEARSKDDEGEGEAD